MRSFIVFGGLALGAAGLIGGWLDRGTSAPAQPPETKASIASAPASSGARVVSIGRDHRGHFKAHGRVDGRQVSFMVDTGASVIALTERDADRLGVRPSRNAFTASVQTANGVVRAAPVTLNSVDIGGLVVRDVQGAGGARPRAQRKSAGAVLSDAAEALRIRQQQACPRELTRQLKPAPRNDHNTQPFPHRWRLDRLPPTLFLRGQSCFRSPRRSLRRIPMPTNRSRW